MKQILYGVGKSVLRDFADPTQIVAMSNLKDVTVNFGGDEDEVTGGDSPYPITTFPKGKTITITATNALFSMKFMNVTQGASVATGVVSMTEFIEGVVPSNGLVDLDYAPTTDSVVITGFEEVETSVGVVAGKFFVDTVGKQIEFAVADAGKDINGVYDRPSSATAETISIMQDTISKPFSFTHRIPVYDDNSQIVGQGQLVVFKAKAKGAFEFNLQPQTAYAPKIELSALDPRRTDGKLWDFTIDVA